MIGHGAPAVGLHVTFLSVTNIAFVFGVDIEFDLALLVRVLRIAGVGLIEFLAFEPDAVSVCTLGGVLA